MLKYPHEPLASQPEHEDHVPNILLGPSQNSHSSLEHGLYKVLKAFHRNAGPCWLRCFPQLCQVDWMSFGCWTIPDTQRKLLSVKNPAALQFFTHSNRCAWHLLPSKRDHLDSPGQSMSWKEQVFLMFCTLSVYLELEANEYLIMKQFLKSNVSPVKETYRKPSLFKGQVDVTTRKLEIIPKLSQVTSGGWICEKAWEENTSIETSGSVYATVLLR